jgi:hypothetical protein
VRRFLVGFIVPVVTLAVLLAPDVSSRGSGAATLPPAQPVTMPVTRSHHASVTSIRSHTISPTVLAAIRTLRAKWQRVAICEVGGNWSMTGQVYSGIGFSNATWYQYGGTQYAPLAGLASEDQQILIGMRVTHGWVPDQYGCSTSGW